jgi:hypothetical protein
MTVALTSGVVTAWWITLGVGVVVMLVVVALLELLRRTVHKVRIAVDDVLSMGGRLAQNTWTVQLIRTTRDRADGLVEQLEEQLPNFERSEG